MKRLSITQLVPGMTVAEDVYDLDHELLIQKGTILTDKLINFNCSRQILKMMLNCSGKI